MRMTEICACHARVQLNKGQDIVTWRIEQAKAILAAIGDIPGLRRPVQKFGCRHVYYTIPFLVDPSDRPGRVYPPETRAWFCKLLREMGVPIVEGYVEPLYRLPAFSQFARSCPVAEDLHDRRLLYIENCAWDFTPEQIRQVGEAFHKAAEAVKL